MPGRTIPSSTPHHLVPTCTIWVKIPDPHASPSLSSEGLCPFFRDTVLFTAYVYVRGPVSRLHTTQNHYHITIFTVSMCGASADAHVPITFRTLKSKVL